MLHKVSYVLLYDALCRVLRHFVSFVYYGVVYIVYRVHVQYITLNTLSQIKTSPGNNVSHCTFLLYLFILYCAILSYSMFILSFGLSYQCLALYRLALCSRTNVLIVLKCIMPCVVAMLGYTILHAATTYIYIYIYIHMHACMHAYIHINR